jgi:hypothetical protein
VTLPAVARWSDHDKAAFAELIAAKGGPCELEYLHRLDRHKRLRKALAKLASHPP